MAFKVELEPNEKLALQIAFKISEKTGVFNFAVSNQALYWPAVKAFVLKGDPTFPAFCRKPLRSSRTRRGCYHIFSALWRLGVQFFIVERGII
jgi:hypothetical protein